MNKVRSYTSYEALPKSDPVACAAILKQIEMRSAIRTALNNSSDEEIERLYNLMFSK